MPASVSIQDAVVDAVKAKLAAMTRANGYSDDFGLRIYDYYESPTTAAPPCLMLVQDQEELEPGDFGSYRRTLPLVVVGLAAYAGTFPTQRARAIIAEIELAMGLDFSIDVPREPDGATVAHVVRMVATENVPLGRDLADGRAYCEVRFELTYSTNIRNPRRVGGL